MLVVPVFGRMRCADVLCLQMVLSPLYHSDHFIRAWLECSVHSFCTAAEIDAVCDNQFPEDMSLRVGCHTSACYHDAVHNISVLPLGYDLSLKPLQD